MAILYLENGQVLRTLEAIQAELADLNIQLQSWPVGDATELRYLLNQQTLDDGEKAEVLQALNHYFVQLQTDAGYQSCDLIVLHSEVANLDALLAKFDRIHTHSDDEVRYIIDGEGVFGFVRPDGQQMHLTVQAEDYINVPANTEHWFYLTSSRRIKAVRYFSGMGGWVPNYTETTIRPLAVLAS